MTSNTMVRLVHVKRGEKRNGTIKVKKLLEKMLKLVKMLLARVSSIQFRGNGTLEN